jgi:hypothetical protein
MDATDGPLLRNVAPDGVNGVASIELDVLGGVGGAGSGASGGSPGWRGISRKGLPKRYWRRFV